jgi:hypothetical protein
MSASLILSASGNNGRQIGSMLAYRESLTGNGVIGIEFPFTRTTTGMERLSDGLWRDAAINLPRRLWNGTKYSYLYEPARTNLFINSKNYALTWLYNGCAQSASAIVSPNGTTDAFDITCNGTDTNPRITQNITVPAAGTYVQSRFIRKGTADFVALVFNVFTGGTGTSISYFDLVNGTTPTAGARITDDGNGFWLIQSAPYTIDAGDLSGAVQLFITPNTSTFLWASAADNNGKTITLWNSQLEAGSSATSPIITAGSAVLRAADSPVLTNASALIGQQEGTIVFDYVAGATRADDLFSFGANITNNVGLFQDAIGRIRSDIYHGGVAIAITTSVTVTPNTRYRIVLRYKSGDSKVWINGVQVATNSSTFTIGAALSSVRLTKEAYFSGAQPNLLNEVQLQPVLTDAQSLALSQIPS